MRIELSGIEVVNNLAQTRFELNFNGKTAVAEYKLRNGQIFFTHTKVPEELGNNDIAVKLVQSGLDYARREGLKVLPYCSFFRDYIKQHPEFRDILDPRFADRI